MSSLTPKLCDSPKLKRNSFNYGPTDEIMESFDKVFLIFRIDENLPVGYTKNFELALKLNPTFFYVQLGTYFEGLDQYTIADHDIL